MSNTSSVTQKAKQGRGWRGVVASLLIALFVVEISMALFVKRADKTYAISEFAKLPLVFNGRVQPMDSLARNSLLQIRGITEVPLEGNGPGGAWGTWEELRTKGSELTERKWYQFSKRPKKLKPAEWLLEVVANPKLADDRYIFVINHPDLRSLMKLEGGVEKSGLHFYRYNDIKDNLQPILQAEAARASKLDATLRTPYDRAVLQLSSAWTLYFRLKNTLQPEDSKDFRKELDDYIAAIKHARSEAQERQAAGEKLDRETIDRLLEPVQRIAQRYEMMARMDTPLAVPLPHPGEKGHEIWHRMGDALMESNGETMAEPVKLLAGISSAYQAGDVAKFNESIKTYQDYLVSQNLTKDITKSNRETFFNQMLAFKRSMYIYIAAFLLVLLYWAGLNDVWRTTASRLLMIGFVVHTAGLIFRMWLEARPPVTNLYSSAIFIGWGAVVLGLVLERFYKDGIGIAVATCVGFLSLVVAHNLALGGDTMEMMRAVLDTNFWLATHVVVITLGYASTFVSGFLALVYIVRGVFTKTLTTETGKGLARMVYAIVCFSTLFSFVGTVLGGIWADQSWGRFWGWDPKENGALMIVLWNVLILHLRWGGMIRERGLMNCAIVGNIITSWSWFGVNMLGIGLHSYGFMDAAFMWLMLFVGSQLLLIGIGLTPSRFWASSGGISSCWPRRIGGIVASVAFLPWIVVFVSWLVGKPVSSKLAELIHWPTSGVWWTCGIAFVHVLVMIMIAIAEAQGRQSTPSVPSPSPAQG
ncbi:MAG: cytochrome c biogenesis protein CcsA [Verrucomicrobia bacterium]|nr:cytochrome c biogenesis protein CcsA [Verrucomicrobiota bacterium]